MRYIIQRRKPGSTVWTDYPNLGDYDQSLSIHFASLMYEEAKMCGQVYVVRVVRVGRFTGRLIEEVWTNHDEVIVRK